MPRTRDGLTATCSRRGTRPPVRRPWTSTRRCCGSGSTSSTWSGAVPRTPRARSSSVPTTATTASPGELHERSRFVRRGGRWLYLDGPSCAEGQTSHASGPRSSPEQRYVNRRAALRVTMVQGDEPLRRGQPQRGEGGGFDVGERVSGHTGRARCGQHSEMAVAGGGRRHGAGARDRRGGPPGRRRRRWETRGSRHHDLGSPTTAPTTTGYALDPGKPDVDDPRDHVAPGRRPAGVPRSTTWSMSRASGRGCTASSTRCTPRATRSPRP